MKSFTDATRKAYASVVLAGKGNYHVWSFTMKEHLTTAGLINYVGKTKVESPEEIKKAQEAKL